MNEMTKINVRVQCGLIRRFAAIGYDSLLLFAVLFSATAMLMPFTSGAAILSGNIFYLIYLLGISFIFFTWQWTHGGQTLGMRAWKIKLYGESFSQVCWSVASKRFFLALVSWLFAGAGFFWAIFDHDKISFHDRYSGSILYKTEPRPADE